MGVLNVTPDSFSDGGRFFEHESAVARGVEMVAAGADLLDVGGESTRPGAEAVPEGQELDRILPVLKRLAAEVDVPLSIDTRKPEVAGEALEAGEGKADEAYHRYLVKLPRGAPLSYDRAAFTEKAALVLNGERAEVLAAPKAYPDVFLADPATAARLRLELAEEGREVALVDGPRRTRAYGKSTSYTNAIGVVVPSMSRSTSDTPCSLSR